VIVRNLDPVCVPIFPSKTNPKLVVNANAVLSSPVTPQRLQPVGRGRAQVPQLLRAVDLHQLPQRHAGNRLESPYNPPLIDRLGILVSKGADHTTRVQRLAYNGNQTAPDPSYYKRATSPHPTVNTRQLPPSVWALGVTSMLMDLASELVHSLLPVFLVSILHTNIATIGLLEGVAESIASITKVFSGALSDHLGKRKPIALFGYGLAAITKFAFPIATSVLWVATAQSLDRFGKGIRGAPRDALVTDLTPPERRGAAFGLRQSLDSLGSLSGPAVALLLMWLLHDNVRQVLWMAPIPAMAAVLAMILWVKEPPSTTSGLRSNPLTLKNMRRFDHHYWMVSVLGAVFTLARFSEAFLVLRAQDSGMPIGLVPLVLIVMNIVYMLVAYPAGTASDEGHHPKLLIAGLAALVAADIVLARAASPVIVLVGAALWGLHMALTQGTLAKLVADATPADLRGTGFGVFNLITGVSTLFASLIAGALWSTTGPYATFLAGAAFAAIAAIGLSAYGYGKNKPAISTP
jgi:sugar phosphate permease